MDSSTQMVGNIFLSHLREFMLKFTMNVKERNTMSLSSRIPNNYSWSKPHILNAFSNQCHYLVYSFGTLLLLFTILSHWSTLQPYSF